MHKQLNAFAPCAQCGNPFLVEYPYEQGRKFCGRACYIAARKLGGGQYPLAARQADAIILTTEDVERFWQKTQSGKPNECWIGGTSFDRDGYGVFAWRKEGKFISSRMHRISYTIHFGSIPTGGAICHTCDNRRCVNPSHLYLGTNKTNMEDRQRAGHYANGVKNWAAKLSDNDVKSIREQYSSGQVTKRRLAQIYGISESASGRIINGQTWQHLS